jgi:hypothetical protein
MRAAEGRRGVESGDREIQAVQGSDRHADRDGGPFYPAEDYHQDYYKKNPVQYQLYRSGCGRDARLERALGRLAPQSSGLEWVIGFPEIPMNARDTRPSDGRRRSSGIAAMPAFLEAALHEAGEENLSAARRPGNSRSSSTLATCATSSARATCCACGASSANPRRGSTTSTGRRWRRRATIRGQDAHAAAQDFAAARRELLAVLATLSAQDLARGAVFDGRRISLTELVTLVDAHDTGHREEIERILDDIED